MPQNDLRIREIFVGIVVVGILVALFVPPFPCSKCPTRSIRCANNLRQLYQLQRVYASTHMGAWPAGTGSDLWLALTRTSPPMIESASLEILGCPVRGEWEPGQCDYLGPRKPVSELKPGDALAADKPGNHGERTSGNVLLKDGSVQEYEYSNPIWDTLAP